LIRAGLTLAFALGFTGAMAAELPQRPDKLKGAEAKSRACFINGEPGVETPGGGCIRVSGSISSQVSAGALKH